jgi:hypothetical protein
VLSREGRFRPFSTLNQKDMSHDHRQIDPPRARLVSL